MILTKGRELRQLGKNIPDDVALQIADKVILKGIRVLRVLPKRRMVFVTTWKNRQVIAKVFFDCFSKRRHAEREWQNTQLILQAGLSTPACLARLSGKGMQVLIYEYLDATTPVSEITPALVETIATLHRAGFYQPDMHCQNFLEHDGEVVIIDVGSIQHRRFLTRRESFNNLALLVAQFPLLSPQAREHIYTTYCQSRQLEPDFFADFEKRVISQKQKRARHYFGKLLRETSANVCLKERGKFVMCNRALWAKFQLFFDDPEKCLKTAAPLKAGNSSSVFLLDWHDKKYVVKRYNVKSFWHFLRRALRATRAVHSWRFSHLLHHFEIATPSPVGMMEYRVLGLRRHAYFVMEYLEADRLADYMATHNEALQEEMANRVNRLFYQLIMSRISHGDLKESNILIHDNIPFLIDLDGMHWYRSAFACRQVWKAHIERFLCNWSNFPSLQALFMRITRY